MAVQLYSVRKDCEADLPGTLEAIAGMGYDGVEFYSYYGRPAAELRRHLDGLGLKVAGTHTALNTLLGDELPRTVAYNQEVGNRLLIVPSLPRERRESRQAWLDAARLFDEIAQRLEPHGMRTGYHNHSVEFQPLGGELPWDTFFGHTRDDVVMQLDLGNAMHGGGDPVPFIAKYPGRSTSIHLKDYSATNDKALIGEGDVPWSEVFRLCESVGGTQWYVVEQESYAYPPLECIRRCRQNLRRMGR
jgi:sugar phosphate isomerase/epimerase